MTPKASALNTVAPPIFRTITIDNSLCFLQYCLAITILPAYGGVGASIEMTIKIFRLLFSGDLLHFLPGHAPELNPNELVRSHMKRTGVARTPLRKGEYLTRRVAAGTLEAMRRK